MRRLLLIVFVIGVLAAAVVAWLFLGSATGFSGNKTYLYISSAAPTKNAVMDSLRKKKIYHERSFNWLANRLGYWNHIRPGKYENKQGASILGIVRMLRNGSQSPVKLTVRNFRTKEDLARLTGRLFEFDSVQMMRFLNSNDSVAKYNITAEQAFTMILPDTYTFYWNTTPGKVYKKLADVAQGFWTPERREKAKMLQLSQQEVYTIASIIQEETNDVDEMDTIASVYLNRLKKGEKLQADPTVKYALRDFSITRVMNEHTRFPSPYNT